MVKLPSTGERAKRSRPTMKKPRPPTSGGLMPNLITRRSERNSDESPQTSVEGTLEALSKEVGPEIWAHIAPKMIEALETMPKNVGEMIASNDPEARLEGARLVADRAARMAGPMAAAPAAAATTTEEGVPASVARKLSGASVATGALRPAAVVPATEQTKEEAIAAFKKELLETETTNVASGLTYAK